MAQRGYGEPVDREWGSDDRSDYRIRERSTYRRGDGDRWRDRESDEERGFFEKAGDEIRSWFQDEEERRYEHDRERGLRGSYSSYDMPRRDRDFDRGHGRSAFGRDFDRDRDSEFGLGRGEDRSSSRYRRHGLQSWQGDRSDQRSSGDRQRQRGDEEQPAGVLIYEEYTGTLGGFGNQQMGRPEDQIYRNWRDRQIKQLDREYQDYCREREQQFHQEFDQWRRNRRQNENRADELQLGSAGSGTRELESGSQPSASKSSGRETIGETGSHSQESSSSKRSKR